jgi:hypothetical protein
MKKGILRGIAIMFIMNIVWTVSLLLSKTGILILLWLSPFIASIVTSYSSSKMKFISGLIMSIIFGVFMVFDGIIFEAVGNRVEGYLYGLNALWAFFILSLPVCIVGSLIGIFLIKIKKAIKEIHNEEDSKE